MGMGDLTCQVQGVMNQVAKNKDKVEVSFVYKNKSHFGSLTCFQEWDSTLLLEIKYINMWNACSMLCTHCGVHLCSVYTLNKT